MGDDRTVVRVTLHSSVPSPMLKSQISLVFVLSAFAVAAPPTKDYELMFEDNFDGSRVNEAVWRYREGPRTSGTWINGLNRKENVLVKDGDLVVRCMVEKINGKTENTGGGLISKANFGYGYYETRSKPFMAGKGVHSAFWQAGANRDDKWDGNNSIFEIDSYEIDSGHFIGANNLYVHLAPAGMNELPWPYRNGLPFKLDRDGWWIDAYEYTPEGVTFYEHGKVVGQADFTDLCARQMVWLTALNGVGKVDADKQPADTRFDYFRYYAKDFPGHNLLPNGGFEYNQGKNPNSPISWRREGSDKAFSVIKGDAARDGHYLRVGDGNDFDVRLFQKLEFIRNGIYQLAARVRNPGGKVKASLMANGRKVDIPASDEWSLVRLNDVPVTEKTVEIALTAVGDSGNALCIDDIQFKKPVAPGGTPPPERPFTLDQDPIWKIAMNRPIDFSGDASFFFISRNVGFGDAMTLKVDLTPKIRAAMCPIMRTPPKGRNGWAVVLGDKGELAFRIGSKADFTEIVVPDAYQANRKIQLKCVYQKGSAAVFVNGKKMAEKSGIAHGVKDSTQAGTFGATLSGFDAIGEVIGESRKPKGKGRNYVGSVSRLQIFNRVAE